MNARLHAQTEPETRTRRCCQTPPLAYPRSTTPGFMVDGTTTSSTPPSSCQTKQWVSRMFRLLCRVSMHIVHTERPVCTCFSALGGTSCHGAAAHIKGFCVHNRLHCQRGLQGVIVAPREYLTAQVVVKNCSSRTYLLPLCLHAAAALRAGYVH